MSKSLSHNPPVCNPPTYCSQNNGACNTCSLVNYGMDCRNNLIFINLLDVLESVDEEEDILEPVDEEVPNHPDSFIDLSDVLEPGDAGYQEVPHDCKR
jgi:hypothetical protein